MGATGSVNATNEVTAYYSDMRLKENIKKLENSLEKIRKISGVTFNSNELAAKYGYDNKSEQVGVIAQEIEEVLPQIVKIAPFDLEYIDGKESSKSGEYYKTVQYEKIVPLLIESIKELADKVLELESKIK